MRGCFFGVAAGLPALLITLLVSLLASAPARALESAPATSAHAVVTLVSESDAIEPGRPTRIGLRFQLAPGWHIYWTNPGDAGTPPELQLALSGGARAGEIAWPVPERLREGPVMTYGYLGAVTLPVPLTPGPGADPLSIDAKASWLVCEKLCVPEDGSFHLVLPPGQAAPSAQAPLFAAADARRPVPSPFPAAIAPDGTLRLTGAGLSAATLADAWFFPAAPDTVEPAAPQPLRVGDGALNLALKPGPSFDPKAGLDGVLVLRDRHGGESYLQLAARPGAAPAEPPLQQESLPGLLLSALLGGLVLNLMPCVFPVLAMKALAIARLSGAARGTVRAHALSYTAGVLAAFAGLGAALLGLRAAGEAAGWGFQFQSPAFVAATAWLLVLVGLNLSGVFGFGAGLAGTGQAYAGRGGHAGSFFTGLLAVVVATPCTAPFMGAAIAGALAAPAPLTIAVFLVMGLGLAAPYALLAAVPRLAAALPRPGRWMEVLKGALAFPLYAAAVWLVWVVSLEAGPAGVLATAAGLLLVGFAAWVVGVTQDGAAGGAGRAGRRTGRAAALAAGLAAVALLPGLTTPHAGAATGIAGDPASEPFSAPRLAALRAQGRPVFVDMTAAWCVTCLVNERIALESAPVQDAFAAGHVAYLKGDWTREDPEITRFLREHGRDGVPLYVYYPPGGAPAVLPQILTEAEVLGRVKPGT